MTTRNADLAVVLRAPLDRLRSDLEKATGRMNEVTKEWQRNMRGAGQRMEAIGKTLSLRVGLPIAGLAAGMFRLASSIGKVQDALLEVGFSPEQFGDLKQMMKDAGLNPQAALELLDTVRKGLAEAILTGETPEGFLRMGVKFLDEAGKPRPLKDIIAEIIENLDAAGKPKQGETPEQAALRQDALAQGAGLGAVTAAVSPASQAIADMKDKFTELQEQIANMLVPFLADTFIPFLGSTLIPALTKVIRAVEKLARWFRKLPPGVQQGIMMFIGLLAVLGPVIVVIGSAVTTITGLIAVGKLLVIGLGLLLTPIGLVVVAIAAIIAIVVILITRWDEVKAEWIAGWTQIGEFMGMILEKIVGFFKENWAKILGILFPPVGIAMLVAENWGKIVGVVTGIFDSAVAAVKSAVNQIIDLINSVISAWNSLEFGVGPFTVGVGEFKRTFGPWRFGTPDLPLIPKLAEGGEIVRGGMAIVGDAGRELLDMPRGARVTPLPAGAGVGGGGPYFDLRGAAIYDADGLERLVGRMGANVIRHGGWPRLSRGR